MQRLALISFLPLFVCGSSTFVDVDLFRRQGYLLFPGFASNETVISIRESLDKLLAVWNPGSNCTAGMSSLRLKDSDHSFLFDSATKASLFLETRPDTDCNFSDSISKRRAVRKVGHGLHIHDGPFREFALSSQVANIAAKLGYQQPVVVQTVYRLAPPLAPGVDRHQDSGALLTDPPSVIGFWLALEPSDEENGCLQVRPGSHLEPLRERLLRVRKCNSANGGRLDGGGLPNSSSCSVDLVFKALGYELVPPKEEDWMLAVMAPGDLIVIHGGIDHRSAPGTDPLRTRESFQVHMTEATARWSEENWLQYPPGMQFVSVPMSHKSLDEL